MSARIVNGFDISGSLLSPITDYCLLIFRSKLVTPYLTPETRNLKSSASPIVKRAGACGKTARSPLRAKDDEDFALPAARDADRVFRALNSIHIRSLKRGLDNFLRDKGWRCRWTVHLKLSSAHRRLHRAHLHALEKLSLAHASRGRERSDERCDSARPFHNDLLLLHAFVPNHALVREINPTPETCPTARHSLLDTRPSSHHRPEIASVTIIR
jgi:hypothetical protein